MSRLLERALVEVYKLSESEQDSIAAVILDELADDQHWDEEFAQSQDELAKMADKARKDIKAGRVRKIGFDEL
jgi:hypothetical protein